MAPSSLEESANGIESFAELDIPNMTMSEGGILSSIRLCSDSQESRIMSSSRSITIQSTVPSLWTRGQNFQVKFDVYMSGYVYAILDFKFEGFDNYPGPDEEREVHSTDTSIRVDASHDVHYLTCYNPSWVTVGLKRAETHVSGLAYFKDEVVEPFNSEPVQPQIAPGYLSDYVSKNQVWDYEFVARYSISDLQTYGGLPPTDAMSSTSGNPDYYWEGLDNDGFGVPVQYAVHRCNEPPIVYYAGYLVDNEISYPYNSAYILTFMTHNFIEYYGDSNTLPTTNADMYTYNYNWRGVCDEFAVVLGSFLRVVGLPSRLLVGDDTQGWVHAWNEVWTGSTWVHADATWNEFDNPSCYVYSGASPTIVVYNSCGDDSIGQWTTADGCATNGRLDGQDWQYTVDYDGPNTYY
ncbi:MAG: hypothetical protein GF309_12650 [Candidatus Lokiarchaeota archaeon]|nr:hypothetical protein [Candidatus Lokiarchaeota archaeon]